MSLVELSVVDQRYAAVMEVVQHGLSKTEVAARYGVTRQSIDTWVKRYRSGGVEALKDGSHRPSTCPHQMPTEIEARICELRRQHHRWGPARIAWQLRKERVHPLPSESSVYRALVRNGLIGPVARKKKRSDYKRWERPSPMQLWQMDIVGGVLLADGRECKIVTGVDDHSRYCVVSAIVERATGRAVCVAFAEALRRHGVPDEVLTDNGKQFTDRFSARTPAEVLFDRMCRENGITHRLTGPRSPTTTGKIERFHRSLRDEFLNDAPPFTSVGAAQLALDAWVTEYNAERPHQALSMATPSERFDQRDEEVLPPEVPKQLDSPLQTVPLELDAVVPTSGNLSLANRQFWFGRKLAGTPVTIQVTTSTVTLLIDEVVYKQLTNRFRVEDLHYLWSRGARRPKDVISDIGFSDSVEVTRRINATGCIGIGGKQLNVGYAYGNKIATIRLDSTVMHVFCEGRFIKTLPLPVPAGQRMKLYGAHPAPPTALEVPDHHEVQRRVGRHGTVNVAKQKLKIGKLHEGQIVTIRVEPKVFVVLLDDEDPLIIKRLVEEEVTHIRAARSKSSRAERQASTDEET